MQLSNFEDLRVDKLFCKLEKIGGHVVKGMLLREQRGRTQKKKRRKRVHDINRMIFKEI